MRFRKALPAAVVLVAGCSSLQSSDNLLGFITPYRVEVVQGNVLTREQIAQVKPGMTRSQVRDVLGSPLLADIFHGDRWDYVFTIRRQGAEPQRRSVVLMFDGDTLKTVEAGELPTEQEFVAAISTAKPRPVPKLEMTEDERKALPAPPPRAPETAASAVPLGVARDYPPLERQP